MSINIICCMDQSRGIGHNGQLLCHLSEDLQHFKKLTLGQFVCMGRKTYDSLGKPLSKRHNIILSQNKKFEQPIGTRVYSNIEEVIHDYKNYNSGESDLFIIGGSQIYSQSIQFADRMYLTVIQHRFSRVDSYFPNFNLDDWDYKVTGYQSSNEKNDYPHYYMEFERKIK